MSGRVFDGIGRYRPLNKTHVMSPSFIVHGGQYDTKYVVFDVEFYCRRYLLLTKFGTTYLNHFVPGKMICANSGSCNYMRNKVFILLSRYVAESTYDSRRPLCNDRCLSSLLSQDRELKPPRVHARRDFFPLKNILGVLFVSVVG